MRRCCKYSIIKVIKVLSFSAIFFVTCSRREQRSIYVLWWNWADKCCASVILITSCRYLFITLGSEDFHKCKQTVFFTEDDRWGADSPDSLVLPLTGWLQGPIPMPLTAWTLTSYSVHSSRSSIVNSLSRRSAITWVSARPCEPAREYCTLYPNCSAFPLYSHSGKGWANEN